ncbi:DEAD/DEAH box helicase domain-containing protein [Theileria equi strain WA]|uniref:DEAD/DEAH box helicase domain-containing protein n=1 Tax=Theileria equi strain WA TaxID=1537102 RepID=L0B243_THEEQ|nr:DEAD/DEAH box helicase domain-containing protein [Theileria equi strain WA]AFZ81204.1 DEAD/DEAH box helicase domain-containing protein [Theileria equi strain WA]|eukprot:XP_004830870.1 DEAD/DEAH box helicase domain-containing protein [Theileria equi strain WA]
MANIYGNEDDFWTSDEENISGIDDIDSKYDGFGNIYGKNPDSSAKDSLFSSSFETALESLSWIPVISQQINGTSIFEILDKELSDAEGIDIENIENQIYKGILDSSEDEIGAPVSQELETWDEYQSTHGTSLDLPESGLLPEEHNTEYTLNKSIFTVKRTGEGRPNDEIIPRTKYDNYIIPPPDENKNYIRKKWSILDNTTPAPIIENMLINFPFELDDFQKRAIYQLTNLKHIFVSAHTSAGKTVIAEYAIALALTRGEKAIYTSPIKALSNQKYREFKKKFGAESVGIVTGDVSCNPGASCLIVTTEILRNLLYRGDSVISQLGVVIFDEIHYISDLSRGVVWEEVIIMLPKTIQLVMLSATVPNYSEFADWIGNIMQKEVVIVVTNHRPTPLVHYLYIYNRFFLLVNPKGFNKDAYHTMYRYSKMIKTTINKKPTFKGHVQKLQKLVKILESEKKLPVVLFCFNRAKCEVYAKEMPNLNLAYTRAERSKIHLFLKESLSNISEGDKNIPQLRSIIKLLHRGIGIHHSGLLPIIKEIVEILFSKGLIKVLFATETFAMGVNMPARSVVFTSIYKHDGQKGRYLTASEYTQMAGRAGRRGLDSFGSVYIFCSDDPPDLQDLTAMMIEKSTRLESRFRITYNMLLQIQSRDHMNITEMMLKSFREREKMKNIPIFKRDSSKKKQELLSLPKIECFYGEPSIEDYYRNLQYSKSVAVNLHNNLWNHKENLQIFKPGRIIMINSLTFCGTLVYGCIVKVLENKDVQFQVLTLLPENFINDGTLAVDIATSLKYNCPVHYAIYDHVSLNNISFIFDNITTAKPVPNKEDKIILSAMASEIHELVESDRLQLLSFNKKFKQTSMQFYETVLKQRDLFHRLSRNLCTKCHMRETHFGIQCKIVNYKREIEEINKNLRDESLHTYSEMISKLDVLKQLDFLDEKGRPTTKGRIATFITTGDEITLTEVLFQNLLKNLEPEECAAILSAFIYNDRAPEKEAPAPTLGIQMARDRVLSIHSKIDVVQRGLDVRVPFEEFSALCNFSLSYVVYQWAKGVPFHEIMELTELQEGHIVRAITRLDELCRKICQAANIFGDKELSTKIERVSAAIRRDIVFAPSLYLS